MSQQSNRSAVVESLDRRVLLAAFASLSPRGMLSVAGTREPDAIRFTAVGSQIIVYLNGQHASFPKTAVRRLWANGFGGNDTLLNATSLPISLIGGSGSDTLTGGFGTDSIDGGAGDDDLVGATRSGAYITPYTLTGGGGQDTLDYSRPTSGDFAPDNGGPFLEIVHDSTRDVVTFQAAYRLRLTAGRDRLLDFSSQPNAPGDFALTVDLGGGSEFPNALFIVRVRDDPRRRRQR